MFLLLWFMVSDMLSCLYLSPGFSFGWIWSRRVWASSVHLCGLQHPFSWSALQGAHLQNGEFWCPFSLSIHSSLTAVRIIRLATVLTCVHDFNFGEVPGSHEVTRLGLVFTWLM
jgi:hypothetical protein